MDTVDEGLARLEREMIDRGYRIRYRRPDEHFIVTYQLERSDWTGGFRLTEQVAAQAVSASALLDHIERHYGWPRLN